MSQYPYPAPTGSSYPGYGGSGGASGNTTGYPQGSPLMQNQYTPTSNANTYAAPQAPSSPYQQQRPQSASLASNHHSGSQALDTSTSDQDVLFEDGVAKENIPEREMFDFDKYDVDSNPVIQCMLPPKQERSSKIQFGGQIVVLFNSITTIMMILTNFKRNADPEVIQKFGADWEPVTNLMIYSPIGFLLLILLGINNYYSDRIYHDYLMRGIMIDYPQTGEMKYLFKNWKPILFMILTFIYIMIVVIVLFMAGSAVGTVFTFCLNMAVGVGKYWYANQSIESQFVSLSDFIMCFPQRDKITVSKEQREKERADAVMDEMNLKHTAYYMKKVVLNSSEHPSWSDVMRLHRWKSKNYSCPQMFLFHFLVWAFLGALVGACAGYFTYQLDQDTNHVWTNTINPCVHTCANVTKINGASNFTATTCDSCLCSCMHAFQKIHEAYTSKCGEYFKLPTQCNGLTTTAELCGVLSQCAKYTDLG